METSKYLDLRLVVPPLDIVTQAFHDAYPLRSNIELPEHALTTIVCAGGNGRKISNITNRLENITVLSIDVDEDPSPNTEIAALSKIHNALDAGQHAEQHEGQLVTNYPIIAQDALTGYVKETDDGYELIQLGKPKENGKTKEEHIHDTFKLFYDLAVNTGAEFFPICKISSVAVGLGDKQVVVTELLIAIIHRDVLAELASSEGYEQYQEKAKKLGADITKIAGGIALEAFSDVEAIIFQAQTEDHTIRFDEKAVADAVDICQGGRAAEIARRIFYPAEPELVIA